MLYKAIAIILSTILLATVQISTASAGCGGSHGGLTKSYKKQALRQSRPSKPRAVAAAKQKKAVQQAAVAKAPVKEETKTVAEVKAGPENELAVASVEQTCTKFIAATGTTVQIECTKE
jgi:hypothetical protein